jgi:hypothetical protein
LYIKKPDRLHSVITTRVEWKSGATHYQGIIFYLSKILGQMRIYQTAPARRSRERKILIAHRRGAHWFVYPNDCARRARLVPLPYKPLTDDQFSAFIASNAKRDEEARALCGRLREQLPSRSKGFVLVNFDTKEWLRGKDKDDAWAKAEAKWGKHIGNPPIWGMALSPQNRLTKH